VAPAVFAAGGGAEARQNRVEVCEFFRLYEVSLMQLVRRRQDRRRYEST